MPLSMPITDRLPIAVRAYAETARPASKPARKEAAPSEHVVVFDCETTTDESQRLRFGTYQHREAGVLVEAGLFHAEDLPALELAVLEAYGREHGLVVRTRESFVHNVLYEYGYHRRGTIVGFNLPFDLPRISIRAALARGAMYGGFSLTLSEDKRLPQVQVKHVSRRFSLIRFAAPFRSRSGRSRRKRGDAGPVHRGHFADGSTLGSALFARPFDLAGLAEHLNVPSPKLKAEHGLDLTPDYIGYAVRDTQTTYECYVELVRRYDSFGLTRTPVHKIYSEASLGKAYLAEMRIKPWLELQRNAPAFVIALILSAYYGGRSEVRIRREMREVIHCDFLSMYPTVCTLMSLWRFVTANGMAWRDDTDEIRRLLEEITPTALQDPEAWRRLAVLVQIEPEADVLPVRARYELDRPSTIGLNYLSADERLWYTLADCINSKILNGKAPKVIRAIVFEPGQVQLGLKPVAIAGNSEFRVDPRSEDFFKRSVELRKQVEGLAAGASSVDERARLKADALALKIVANATSYGGFVELNIQEHSKRKRITVHPGIGSSFEHAALNEEKPGRFFHPLLATLITGAARLMLGLAEHLAAERGVDWAFCDTDSMSFAKPSDLARDEFRNRVDEIVNWFEPLNPYGFAGSILKIEKYNFSLDPPSEYAPLYCWCVSAKRYALFNIGEDGRPIIRKASAHGLGHLIKLYDERTPPAIVPPPRAKLSDIGVELWHHDLWFQIVTAALDGHPDQVDLAFHPNLKEPAVSQYGATSPRLLNWFSVYNQGRQYREQVKPFGFLYSLFVGQFETETHFPGAMPRKRKCATATIRPIALHNKDLAAAIKTAFDRDTKTPVAAEKLRSYKLLLAQYHLQPEAKFLNGDYLDRGTTLRRHVRLTGLEFIGKEANRWEEQEHLGLFPEAEITYGSTTDPSVQLAGRIVRLKPDFGQREIAYRLGWSRGRIAKLLAGKSAGMPRSVSDRAMRALERLRDEAAETRDELGRVRAEVRIRIDRDGLTEVAADLKVDPSNLLKIARGQRRPTRALLDRLSGDPHAG